MEAPKRSADKPLPNRPEIDELPQKPSNEELLEKPKEREIPKVPERIKEDEIIKDKIKVTKNVYVQYRSGSGVATTVRTLEPTNKRSSSANTLTIRRLK